MLQRWIITGLLSEAAEVLQALLDKQLTSWCRTGQLLNLLVKLEDDRVGKLANVVETSLGLIAFPFGSLTFLLGSMFRDPRLIACLSSNIGRGARPQGQHHQGCNRQSFQPFRSSIFTDRGLEKCHLGPRHVATSAGGEVPQEVEV